MRERGKGGGEKGESKVRTRDSATGVHCECVVVVRLDRGRYVTRFDDGLQVTSSEFDQKGRVDVERIGRD